MPVPFPADVPPPRRPVASVSPSRADRALRLAGTLLCTYLAVALWPMLRYTLHTGRVAPLAMHVAALAVAVVVSCRAPGVPSAARDWLPLAAGPFLYIELRWLIEGTGLPHRDALVISWEQGLFPGNPSASWAPAVPSVALSELLHLAYASYYLLVYLPPLLLWLRGQRDEFARTMLALTLVYAACFIAYLLFPVDGPRYLLGAAAAPDGPVRDFVLQLLAAGSSRGTAFPSSHVAASCVASLAALAFQRRTGLVVALFTAGLTAGTVFGGFHYAVDALAGVVTGVLAWWGAGSIWRALSIDGEQSATAA